MLTPLLPDTSATTTTPGAPSSGLPQGQAACSHEDGPPVFTRSSLRGSLSSIGSDNEDPDPPTFEIRYLPAPSLDTQGSSRSNRYVTLYRGCTVPPEHAAPEQARSYGCLSPLGRELVDQKKMSPERALIEARKAARHLAKDPVLKERAVVNHLCGSNSRVFPNASDPNGMGPSPFVSVSSSKSIASSFAMPLPAAVSGGGVPYVFTFEVHRSKVIPNPYNDAEQELLIKGGVNPRHLIKVQRATDPWAAHPGRMSGRSPAGTR